MEICRLLKWRPANGGQRREKFTCAMTFLANVSEKRNKIAHPADIKWLSEADVAELKSQKDLLYIGNIWNDIETLKTEINMSVL